MIIIQSKSDLIISTNPKWLLFIPLLCRKKYTLYLGDPLTADVARKDSIIYTIIWKLSLKLIKRMFVFSPYLYERMKCEYDGSLVFKKRHAIKNLPQMKGKGILYLGDFSSKDRNFEPLLEAIEVVDVRLHLYGNGDSLLFSNNIKCSIYERRMLSELMVIIPNYRIMVALLNRSGCQIPGKIYDFMEAPFKVLVLYEDYMDISKLPRPDNYFYCINNSKNIRLALNELL